MQFITTNETELVIQDLNPFLSYSVSVAATNAAGMGDYSSEVTVGGKISVNVTVYSIYLNVYYFCSTSESLRILPDIFQWIN